MAYKKAYFSSKEEAEANVEAPRSGVLPTAFREKIGLDTSAMQLLVNMNDHEYWTFKEIAAWIRKNL